ASFKAIHGLHSPFVIELEGKSYAVIRNHRGDITALLDDENAVATYRYDAFGDFVHEGEIESPWLLFGQRFDTMTGTYQFAKRAYDPQLGIWLTPDPAGFADGPNLYAYVNNNPLIYVDPYGLWKEECEALGRSVKEFTRGSTRGFVDDASFGTSDYVLGEHQHSSLSNRIGYYAGTGGSLAAGCFYGTTWIKGGAAAIKGSLTAFRMIKRAFTTSKNLKNFKHARQITQMANESELAVKQARLSVSHNFKTADIITEKTETIAQWSFSGSKKAPHLQFQISKHAQERMELRGISKKMIEAALRKGVKYYDPKNDAYSYILKEGFASGKSLLVGQNPSTGRITTVIRGSKLENNRFQQTNR
ncbi:MAG: RHS repeat-associated core domain-containing protein, partial [Parachlamydiaceae bacterium]